MNYCTVLYDYAFYLINVKITLLFELLLTIYFMNFSFCVPAGFVLDVNGLVLAQVLNQLGAGRSKAGEPVNHSVGAELLVLPGQSVRTGESLKSIHKSPLFPRVWTQKTVS